MTSRRLPTFMNQDTMAVVTPSRSKEWRNYNIWPPPHLHQKKIREKDETYEMIKTGVFTTGETYKETVDMLYDHETRVTEIDKFMVKQRMKEERCYYREHNLIKRERERIERANAIVHRKKKIREENRTRDAILKSYGQFKQEVEEESECLDEFHNNDLAALDGMRQKREFVQNMDTDMATLLTDVALGSGSITLAKTIRTEILNTELIRHELADTLSTAQKKDYHRSQLRLALEKHHARRVATHTQASDGEYDWGGPRGSSPRRASLEYRGAKIFQKRWRGYAARSVEHRAASVLNVVDERSNGSKLFEATALRMVTERGKESPHLLHLFNGELGENARHIRLLAHNLKKFQSASRRLVLVEEGWKTRAAESRELSLKPEVVAKRASMMRRSSSRRGSNMLVKEGGVVDEGLLEEGMALHKERAMVDAAVSYTAASILQRFFRIIQVENGTFKRKKLAKRGHDAHADVRRNRSRERVHELWDKVEGHRIKAMLVGFTLFQLKIRHFLAKSVVERESKATIGRLAIRKKYSTIGVEIMDGLREERREALCSAVTTTVLNVRKRLLQMVIAWHEWAKEQGERRGWLLGRDARRRALIIEEMLYARLLLKRKVRAEVLRDMGGSMTRVLTKYKQSRWDWCSLLVALDDEMHRMDPNALIARRILERPKQGVDKDRLRKLQGHRSPLNPHKALVYLLHKSDMFKRIAVPAREDVKQFVPAITVAATPMFPEIVNTSHRDDISNQVISPSGRFSTFKPKQRNDQEGGTWDDIVSSELMFADELMRKELDEPAAQSNEKGKFKFKVGGGEAELEARRIEARKDDAHVHRHLTIALWRFLGACGDFFKRCSANAVSRDVSSSLAEEREMLDGFLGKFLEVRQESLPYVQIDGLKKVKQGANMNPGTFYRWLHECEYCPECYALAAHPTGEGHGVVDWSDPLKPKPPRRKCPSCGYRFISRFRADTGIVASRLRSQSGVSSQEVLSVSHVDEPVSSLFLHAAIASLSPVGSWIRDKGLSVVWAQAVEVAKPIIDRAKEANITTIALLSERRNELYTLRRGYRPGIDVQGVVTAESEEDKVLMKAVSFLKILDELIIRRREERKEADLHLLSDLGVQKVEREKQALKTRQVTIDAARISRLSTQMNMRTSSGRGNGVSAHVSFEGRGEKFQGSLTSNTHSGGRESRSRESKTSRTSSLFGDFPSAPGTPQVKTDDAQSAIGSTMKDKQESRKVGARKPKGKVSQGGMFAGAEYRIRPLNRRL